MIVDLIAQLYKIIHPLHIDLYLIAREYDSEEDNHTSFLQASGYATLLELNAMLKGQYHPLDIYGKPDKEGKVGRIQYPYDFSAYLVSNKTVQGEKLDNETLADRIADRIMSPAGSSTPRRICVTHFEDETFKMSFSSPANDPNLKKWKSKYQYMIQERNGEYEKLLLHTESIPDWPDL